MGTKGRQASNLACGSTRKPGRRRVNRLADRRGLKQLRYYMYPMAGKRDNPVVLRQDTRLLPAYSFHDAAKYLRIPVPTLRSWVGLGKSPPVFTMDDPERRFLSFMNLVEAHILAGIRRKQGVRLPQVRRALDYVRRTCGVERPLIDQGFQTDGHFLFVEWTG